MKAEALYSVTQTSFIRRMEYAMLPGPRWILARPWSINTPEQNKSRRGEEQFKIRIQRQKPESMANFRQSSCNSVNNPPLSSTGSGVCMMNSMWKEEQHPSFIHFISSYLSANSYRLNFLTISPDFIFNNGGVSVAFIFVTSWVADNISSLFSRVQKLKEQFRHFYVIVTLPDKEKNDSFVRSYFNNGMQLGRPTFIPVKDQERGFEKMVNIAHIRGVLKKDNTVSKLKAERQKSVERMEAFSKVITSVPGIDSHDANTLIHAVGSIEAIAKASKTDILENTDLSEDKAQMIVRFFNDSKYLICPKIEVRKS